MQRSDFEIMAPAGSRESLAAALRAGADAVYFGAGGLNMRNRSSANFSLDDLEEIATLCRRCGVKSYLTVNTIIYDEDLPLMRSTIDRAKSSGVSAIIASDMAAILYARSIGQKVHISTQVNISNTEAVRHFAQWADVMVLARELNLGQVKEIHRAIERENICGPSGEKVRLEMFCHGALCMAVSGKCYLSLHEMDSSANRGSCGQICRRSYTVTDRETGRSLDIENQYIMSPKDLKTIGFLDRMADAGVRILKIEGRARGPEYVAQTVSAYNEALNALCEGRFTSELKEELDERLARVFNRGFWDGYYLGHRLGEWSDVYGSAATHRKEHIGRARRWYPRLGVGEFKLESGELRPGDTVIVAGSHTGALTFDVAELRLDREPEQVITKGQIFSMPCPGKVRPGDHLYLWRKISD